MLQQYSGRNVFKYANTPYMVDISSLLKSLEFLSPFHPPLKQLQSLDMMFYSLSLLPSLADKITDSHSESQSWLVEHWNGVPCLWLPSQGPTWPSREDSEDESFALLLQWEGKTWNCGSAGTDPRQTIATSYKGAITCPRTCVSQTLKGIYMTTLPLHISGQL